MDMIMGGGSGECGLNLEISFAVVGFCAETLVPQLNVEGDRQTDTHTLWLMRELTVWGSLWTRAMKDAVKPSFDSHDGEFWMCEKDFLKLGGQSAVNKASQARTTSVTKGSMEL